VSRHEAVYPGPRCDGRLPRRVRRINVQQPLRLASRPFTVRPNSADPRLSASLSGGAATPPGAPLGRGDAIVAFHGQSALCWRFAHLHGFTQAASAQIHAGRPGRTGVAVVSLSTGSKLHHHGCVSITPTLATAIVHGPNGYYVTIPSARYPAGAVRAQL
jgi:hypothetical protein